MDTERFDQMTRLLSTGRTRRRVIRLLGGALVGGAVRARPSPAAAQQATCEVDADCPVCSECLSGVCVPIMNDSEPRCDFEAAGGCADDSCDCILPYCQNGACKIVVFPHLQGKQCSGAPDDGNPCTTGRCQDGFCRNELLADGTTCPDGACSKGTCCPAGWSSCGGACADTKTDAANCGACGEVCAAGETCQNGDCATALEPACKPGLTRCNGRCVNLNKNEANCGRCGRRCQKGSRCRKGNCRRR